MPAATSRGPGALRGHGFTLIELVAVLVVSSIIATVVFRNIARPVEALIDVSRRAALTDVAGTALARIARELRLALPGSVRVAPGGQAIELMRTVTGGRYRAQVDAAGGGDALDFDAQADRFDVLGGVSGITIPPSPPASGQANCLDRTAQYCLVIFNTGLPGADAWNGDNIAGVSDATATSLAFDNSDVPGWSFPLRSPRQRFFIVDTPVSYVCDLAAGELRRYADYPIAAVQAVPPAGGASALAADRVSACRFTFDPGTPTRNATVTIVLTLSEAGESVTLLQQVHLPNAP